MIQLPLFLPESDWTVPELPDLRNSKLIVLDVETRDDALANDRGPGWVYDAGHVAGLAIGWERGAIYVPINHPDTECVPHDNVKRWLEDHLKIDASFITHHGSYDWGWLSRAFGVRHPAKLEDTEAMAVMIDENRLSYKLDSLCAWQGIGGKQENLLREAGACYGVKPEKIKENLWRLPARFVGPYAARDAEVTLDLYDRLAPQLVREEVVDAYRLEMELVPIVHAMRNRGIRIDLKFAKRAEQDLLSRRDQAVNEISSLAGRAVTIAQLRRAKFLEALHDEQGIMYPRTAKTGQGSFTDDWMKEHDHWLPRLVSRATRMDAAANKFIGTFILDFTHRGRIHAQINQFLGEDGGTRSHRFSYSGPPLQQSPARDDEIAALFRGSFRPEEGEVWLSADYSQQELRRMVHYADILKLRRASEAADRYRSDPSTDFHQMVIDWTGLDRKPAKNASFAKSYGAGKKKFAAMIGRALEEAEAIWDKYDSELPFVSQLARYCERMAERRGYIKLSDGARSHFDLWEPASWEDRNSAWGARPLDKAKIQWPGKRLKRANCRKAMNRLIQGTCARVAKRAIVECARAGYVPMLQMHDELCFSVATESDGNRIGEIMREVDQMTIPSKVDLEYGVSWGDAKHAWSEVERRD